MLRKKLNLPSNLENDSANTLSESANPFSESMNHNIESMNQNIVSMNQNIESINQNIESMNPNIESMNPNIESMSPNIKSMNPNIKSMNPNSKSTNPLNANIESNTHLNENDNTTINKYISNVNTPDKNHKKDIEDKNTHSDRISSKYFSNRTNEHTSLTFLQLESELITNLNAWLSSSTLPKIHYVYQPLEYAHQPHSEFIHRYCNGPKKILFMGINPGPYGMCQTGVPFGEINSTREWLEVEGEVAKPRRECPDRPITGFACKRSEVSGKRFWGLFKNVCKSPGNFFRNCFVYNYCPLAFMDAKGKNITPDGIKGDTQKRLEHICDDILIRILILLEIDTIITLGRYAEQKITKTINAAPNLKAKITIKYMTHPSPIIPKNQDWEAKAKKQLEDWDLIKYFGED